MGPYIWAPQNFNKINCEGTRSPNNIKKTLEGDSITIVIFEGSYRLNNNVFNEFKTRNFKTGGNIKKNKKKQRKVINASSKGQLNQNYRRKKSKTLDNWLQGINGIQKID